MSPNTAEKNGVTCGVVATSSEKDSPIFPTISWRAGHQCSLCHFSSATAATKRNHNAGGTTSSRGGGGQGAARSATPRPSVGVGAIDAASATSPQQQPRPNAIAAPGERRAWGGGKRGRLRRNAADTFRLCVDHQQFVEKLKRRLTWQ